MARISMATGGCTTASIGGLYAGIRPGHDGGCLPQPGLVCRTVCHSLSHRAAGVKLILTPHTSAMFNRAGMLCASGRCKTLDAAADGYVRGEAVVSLLLQQLQPSDAAGTGAASLCYLAGTAVNQDGRSSTLTAPNGPAQQAAVRAALASGGLAASAVAMVQLHGTGTPLGDPIEVGALAAVLSAKRAGAAASAGRPVVLAAGKTSMGHTEPAAGLVGVAHASQALLEALVQPLLHLTKASGSGILLMRGHLSGESRTEQLWMCFCVHVKPYLFENTWHLWLYLIGIGTADERIHGGQRPAWPLCHAAPAWRPGCADGRARHYWCQLLCLPGHQRPRAAHASTGHKHGPCM